MNIIAPVFLVIFLACVKNVVVQDAPNYRLSRIITPVNYGIELTLAEDVFETNIFTGIVRIVFQVHNNTQQITLHTYNLALLLSRQAKLRTLPGTDIGLRNFVNDPITDLVTLQSEKLLEAGQLYELTLPYRGVLRTDDMYGFYKSSYEDEKGNVRFLATTQFQPTFARRAFPCFDEPSFKATFDLVIKHPSIYNAIANTPITNITTTGNITTTSFQTTPVMSTYLLAFIISDFTCSSGLDVNQNYPYRICSRSEAEDTREFAIDIGPPLLWDLENYTSISYNFSGIGKLDQVAIPDFAAGAMENWGLVTYREINLLWDRNESSNRYKQDIAAIIAHEFAHKWFGNLVTTHWWSDTFLNEGFARYFQYHTPASVLPSWEMDKQFVIEQVHSIFQTDALITTSPLSSEVSSPAEVLGRFTSISYNKGGSIFRMVKSFMGSQAFRTGITSYLLTYALDNTTPLDLWRSLDTFATNLPASLPEVMANWTYQAGFPLLQVTSNGSSILISQSRFLLNGTDPTRWYVPISYTRSSDGNKFANTLPQRWLLPNENLVITNVLNGTNWIILNNQETGYYRVDYDDVLWSRIASGLGRDNFDGIIDLNRAQIVDDLFNLAKIGRHSYSRVLELTSFLANDVSYYPWSAALREFSQMLQRTGDIRIRNALGTYILNLMQKLYNDVPFTVIDDDNQVYTLKKVLTLTWACNLGQLTCINNASNVFATYKSSNQRPNPNLRSIVYCSALRHSNNSQDDWDFLWQKYNDTNVASEETVLRQSLGCTTNTTLLHHYLTLSITPNSRIRPQDGLSVFSSVYTSNPEGVDVALDFLIANYERIANYYASLNSLLSLINGISGRFTNNQQLNKLRTFLTTANLESSIKVAAENAVLTAETNLAWTESFERELHAFFRLDGGGAASLSISVFTVLSITLLGLFIY